MTAWTNEDHPSSTYTISEKQPEINKQTENKYEISLEKGRYMLKKLDINDTFT